VIARVVIMPKRGVLDPQGKAVCSSLHTLGYGEVADVRVGRIVEVRLDPAEGGREAASERVRAMCERLLANGVIEDFHFELIDADAPRGSEGPAA
jgi:phosphoribosylformylglycinamidine synthase